MLVGGTPMERTGGKPILASSAATTRSQCKARSVPPARQFPWTWAMTGSAQFQIRAHPSPRASIAVTSPSIAVCWGKSPGSASSAMKPYPEENDRPVLRMITTCTPPSASASATAARQFTNAAGRQWVVLVRTVQRQAPHTADVLDDQRAETCCHSGSAPDSRRDLTTFPLSLRGSASTTVMRRGTL